MLSSVVAILSGKSRIKLTALISVCVLLGLDLYELIEIPASTLSDWFEYGLKVSALALIISLLVDVLTLGIEALRTNKLRKIEEQKLIKDKREKVIGNLKALSDRENFALYYVWQIYGEEFKVSVRRSEPAVRELKSLYEQGIFFVVGGTEIQPRWRMVDEVASEIAMRAAVDEEEAVRHGMTHIQHQANNQMAVLANSIREVVE